MFVEPFDVRIAAQKPEQLVNDGLGVTFFVVSSGNESRNGTADLRAKKQKRCRCRYGRP